MSEEQTNETQSAVVEPVPEKKRGGFLRLLLYVLAFWGLLVLVIVGYAFGPDVLRETRQQMAKIELPSQSEQMPQDEPALQSRQDPPLPGGKSGSPEQPAAPTATIEQLQQQLKTALAERGAYDAEAEKYWKRLQETEGKLSKLTQERDEALRQIKQSRADYLALEKKLQQPAAREERQVERRQQPAPREERRVEREEPSAPPPRAATQPKPQREVPPPPPRVERHEPRQTIEERRQAHMERLREARGQGRRSSQPEFTPPQ